MIQVLCSNQASQPYSFSTQLLYNVFSIAFSCCLLAWCHLPCATHCVVVPVVVSPATLNSLAGILQTAVCGPTPEVCGLCAVLISLTSLPTWRQDKLSLMRTSIPLIALPVSLEDLAVITGANPQSISAGSLSGKALCPGVSSCSGVGSRRVQISCHETSHLGRGDVTLALVRACNPRFVEVWPESRTKQS